MQILANWQLVNKQPSGEGRQSCLSELPLIVGLKKDWISFFYDAPDIGRLNIENLATRSKEVKQHIDTLETTSHRTL